MPVVQWPFLPVFLIISFYFINLSLAQDICFPDACADPEVDTLFSYNACCDNECCYRLRFWVIPATIAGMGFAAGAFFALCFQCR